MNRLVLNEILLATDLLGLLRQLVLESSGTWIKAQAVDIAFLFEVALQGVQGFGLVVLAALNELIANAEIMIASYETANINKLKSSKTFGH